MALPVFGITFRRDSEEPRPTIPSDLSVIGLIGPMAGADLAYFPYHVPVAVYSSDPIALVAAGPAGPGNLVADGLKGINDQLGDFEVSARVVVINTPAGANEDETIANIVGDEGARTGIHGFLSAGRDLACIPRLICAPGYTHQHTSQPGTVVVTRGVKAGGNTGGGTLTLVPENGTHPYGVGVGAGTYQVRAIGGTTDATSAVVEGAGNGTIAMATPSTAGAGVKVGQWRVTCIASAEDGGTFLVEDPDGITRGVNAVGEAFSGDIKFTVTDGSNDFEGGDVFVVTVVPAVPAGGGLFSVRAPDGTMLANATEGAPYTGQVNFQVDAIAADFIVGDGFDIVVAITAGEAEANPICAALPSVLDRIIGHAIVEGEPPVSATLSRDVSWLETMNSSRLIPVSGWVRVLEGSSIVTRPGAARIAGLGAASDYQSGGPPNKSFANLPVQGIVGWARPMEFSLTDGDTLGQTLLSMHMGIGVRGEMNVESAMGASGFIFIGTDNIGDDPLWQFYSVTRMRDYIHLGLLKTLRKRLGRTNITVRGIDVCLDDVRFWLRDLAADDRILRDFVVSFDPAKNSPENLRLGHFRLYFQAEEAPVLTRLDIDSKRYRPALDLLLVDLLASIPPEQSAVAA